MLNKTLAAKAVRRPLAGFGAGAFRCDGAWAGSSPSQLTAGHPVPRIRAVVAPVYAGPAAGTGIAGAASAGNVGGSQFSQLNLMTRIYPVAQGGVGPHPAREPDPV
jgi:hypothetical protein